MTYEEYNAQAEKIRDSGLPLAERVERINDLFRELSKDWYAVGMTWARKPEYASLITMQGRIIG